MFLNSALTYSKLKIRKQIFYLPLLSYINNRFILEICSHFEVSLFLTIFLIKCF